MDQLPEGQSGLREFLHDVRLALRAWGEAPLLPLMSMAFATAVTVLNELWREEELVAIWVLGTLVSLLWLGWYGAERLWYLRVFRSQTWGPGRALRSALKFIGPFFGLGLVVFAYTLPLLGLALLSTAWEDVPAWLASALYGISIDVIATFMTPAVTFSTRDGGKARRLGWDMLKQSWPHCAWYALVPPIAIVTALQIAELEPGSRLGLTLVATLVGLVFKGATAAYYLRRHPEVGDHGWLEATAAGAIN